MKRQNLLKTIAISITLFQITCGEGLNEEPVELKTNQEDLILPSENIITSQDPDFNAWEHSKLFTLLPSITLHKPNEFQPILSATLTARSTAEIEAVQPISSSDIGATCSTLSNQSNIVAGTGFLVGVNLLATAHHVSLYDQPNDTYKFTHRYDKNNTINDWPQVSLANKFLYERLYRLGFSQLNTGFDYFDPTFIDELYEIIDKWKFKTIRDYAGLNRFSVDENQNITDHGIKDIIFEVADPLCIDELNLRIPGPGVFYDWSKTVYSTSDPLFPQQSEYIYSNQIQYIRPKTINNQFVSQNNHPDPTKKGVPYFSNKFAYTVLPGITGAINYQSTSTQKSCGFTITSTKAIQTSLDSVSGSSGGSVLKYETGNSELGENTLNYGSAWGVLTSAEFIKNSPTNSQFNYGFNQNVAGVNTFPTEASTVTPFDDRILKFISNHNRDNKPDNPYNNSTPTPIQTFPSNDVPSDGLAPSIIDKPGDCVGKCNEGLPPQEYSNKNRSCTDFLSRMLYWIPDVKGSSIGIVGVPLQVQFTPNGSNVKKDIEIMGNFGILCSPWSSLPYTEFWHFVRALFEPTYPAKWDKQITHRNHQTTPFSVWYNKISYTELDKTLKPKEQKTLPFQNCPPGYVLKEVEVLLSNEDLLYATAFNSNLTIPEDTILGIRSIRCTRISNINGNDEVIINLRPSFYGLYAPEIHFQTQIGSNQIIPGYTKEPIWAGCDEGFHISGYITNSKNPLTPINQIHFTCTTNPKTLSNESYSGNWCNDYYNGNVIRLFSHQPSCFVDQGSSWGQPGPCPPPSTPTP